ncbi:hypothetical protein TanjilG_23398 [Lupinus angustifolius]|uniref:Transmembrane protein n=1 Tax=Lupinus angustifolius TaxID=3871 RepID=A0A4P1R935_LUPAN|nr:hypothetical protein TanjilG_23398 [Lupinus angustifolius]
MGNYYYCKPRGGDPHTSNVLVILAVALILLVIPSLFSSESEDEAEESMNMSPFVAPIMVIVILLLVSFLGSSRKKVYAKPPWCGCNHACYCYGG